MPLGFVARNLVGSIIAMDVFFNYTFLPIEVKLVSAAESFNLVMLPLLTMLPLRLSSDASIC